MRRRARSGVWLTLYVIVAVADIIGEAADLDRLRVVCLWVLMPLLAIYLLARTGARPGRTTTLVLAALLFSWLGDAAGDPLLVKIVFFLIAQVIYVIAFLPYWRTSLVRKPPALIPYAIVVLALVAVVGASAGEMLVPVAVYGICLGLMAVLSTGVNRTAGLGGVLFVISDSVLAINAFVDGLAIPGAGVWIMVTYLLAQLLLVRGVVKRPRARGPMSFQ